MAYNNPQDEGYSEDPLTLSMSSHQPGASGVPTWIAEMSLNDRARLAMGILGGLPTASVSEIVDALRPRLYINFFDRLPAEVCLKILGFLDSVSLLRTARASRDWMSLSMDWKLWQQLYYLEGWRTNEVEIQNFERELAMGNSTLGLHRPSVDELDEHAHKKRATPRAILEAQVETGDLEMKDVPDTQQLKSIFGRQPQVNGFISEDHIMGENTIPSLKPSAKGKEVQRPIAHQPWQTLKNGNGNHHSTWSAKSGTGFDPSIMSSLVVRDREGNQKLNWQYLYTQRRRLEENWESAKFVNFQLPHPDHLDEAHGECIYTVQQCDNYLVSGSRDKTLRIWDVTKRRLVRPPLKGHTGSVLCLQFDPDPAEDLIVSGSSDATVVLWKFSTGAVLQILKNPHRESVLNVRFDHRILVTCSKDKTIKIFNRHPLHPGQQGYPSGQQAVKPVPTVLNNYGFNPSPSADLPIKPPYSIIGSLEGHGAAVNAVQIYKNEIVSASGDRNVKVWDWPLQTCTRTLVGHQKGIACVQYDGRRIVSGSSDNEVKVFDKETGLEVASLRAHTSLVRTVQAGFGDLPYSAEEDQADARNVDNEYFKAVSAGAVPHSSARRKTRNAGSRRPEDIMAYGAKLPPGGGGGKYGRIVSGSYDETIIIWRRDKDGVWKAQHILRQEDAAIAASQEVSGLGIQDEFDSQSARAFPNEDQWHIHMINTVIPRGPLALRQLLSQHPQLIAHPQLHIAISSEPGQATRIQMRSYVAQILTRQRAAALAHQAAGHPSIAGPAGQPAPTTAAQPIAATVPAQLQTPTTANQHQAASQTHPPATPAPNPGIQGEMWQVPAGALPNQPIHPQLVPPSMARVFKLQFDARRIICCSQTPIIVGWDFANKDEKIIEASRFFSAID